MLCVLSGCFDGRGCRSSSTASSPTREWIAFLSIPEPEVFASGATRRGPKT
jgi:hypothetical protein